ncbi:MAG: hypothetical protein GXP55_09425 [Deltaproteobacteria bacterium]|nr:hypothetical protein [Deltaproteobacteria bacterium]
MIWLERSTSRLGPFADAARAFSAWRHPAGFPPGPEGVRALVRELDAFVHDLDAPEEDEDRFLEGAGALLAALLIAHLPESRHVEREGRHALRLGRWGFFDPFMAIDAALDAESPAESLARALRRAEAEARGEGSMAQALGLFEELLECIRPDLTLIDAFAASLRLGDNIELDISSAMAAASGDEGDLESALSRLIGLIPGGEDAQNAFEWPHARPRLLPRIVSADFLEELDSARPDAPPERRLYRRPLAGDLRLALVLAYPDRARFVRLEELECWGVPEVEVEGAYLAHLARLSRDARFDAVESPEGVMIVARSGDALDSARIVLPGLYGVLAAELTPPFAVAVPHRDSLLAVSGADPEMWRMLARRAREEHARAPHGISPNIFELSRRGPRQWSFSAA